MSSFKAMRYEPGCLFLLDQRQLPNREVWLEGSSLEVVAVAIEDMVVRGAPAIGCAAAWGIVVHAASAAKGIEHTNWKDYKKSFYVAVERMARTRPTAVNLFYALDALKRVAETFEDHLPMSDVASRIYARASELESHDLKTCQSIGGHGASLFSKPVSVLTHCNTGSLATAGYGTALGVIRSLHSKGLLRSVFVDETRPYLQGSRLTTFELKQDGIPFKLITDNMAAYSMQLGWVDLVVVGADRIAANGDTANKIGTYGLAVLCHHHNIPFMVAAPVATIDTTIADGSKIPVEERSPKEILEVSGVSIAPRDTLVWNPSFDVTPSKLISAIITENGIFRGPYQF